MTLPSKPLTSPGVSPLSVGQTSLHLPDFVFTRVEPGKNVLAQMYGEGSRFVGIQAMADEIVDGIRGNRGTKLSQSLWGYTARDLVMLPAGGAAVLHRDILHPAALNVNYLQTLGLMDPDVTLIGIDGAPGQRLQDPLSEVALQSVAQIRGELDRLGLTGTGVLVPFIGSENINRLAGALDLRVVPDNVPAVDLTNNKGYALEELAKRGVKVPYGHWLHGSPSEESLWSAYRDVQMRGFGGRVFGKLARAASGQGVRSIADDEKSNADDKFRAFLAEKSTQYQLADPTMGVRIDAAINATRFPNIMMWVGDTPAIDRYITASDQILEQLNDGEGEFVHAGNIGPISEADWYHMSPTVKTIMDWLRAIGMRGIVGIDLMIELVTNDVYLLEINGRKNGNNAGSFAAIGDGRMPFWGCKNVVKVPLGTTLGDYAAWLEHAGIHFNPLDGRGVFVVNSVMAQRGGEDDAEFGKMQIGAAGNTRQEVVDMIAGASRMYMDAA